MKTDGVDEHVEKARWARPSGDKVALAIAAMVIGGVILFSAFSLGMHEWNLVARVILLSSGGIAMGAGLIFALSVALIKKKPEEVVLELDREGLPEVFSRDLAGSLHLYLIRNKKFGRYQQFQGELDDVAGFLEWFEVTLKKMGLNREQIVQVMEVANQDTGLPVNAKIYEKTGEVGFVHEVSERFLPQEEKTGQIYLIDVTPKGAQVSAVYRHQLNESEKHVRSRVVFNGGNSNPIVTIGRKTNKPKHSYTKVKK